MFEFEFDLPTRLRLRLGRWQIRTWGSRFVVLPVGYRSPVLVYAVERYDDELECSRGQFGVFFNESDALACKRRLEAEGRDGVVINYLRVCSSLGDWQFDR